MGERLIDGPIQKPRSATPVARGETPASKPQRARSVPQKVAEPTLPDASLVSGPGAGVMQSAMQTPVTTGTKRRYPQMPAFDFDTAKEARFLQAHDGRLNAKLKAANLTRGHLLGPKRQGVLHAVGRANKNFIQARNGLLQQLGEEAPPGPLVDRAIERLIEPLARRDAAVARHAEAESKLVKANHSGNPPDIDDAHREVGEAQQALDDVNAAIGEAAPPWARSGAAHGSFMAAATCRAELAQQGKQVAKSMRVLWVQLGDQAFTKLPHFAAGAFGKVALAMRSDGTLCALKVLRTAANHKAGATQVTQEIDARREAGLMQRYYDPSVRLHRDAQTQKLIVEMPLALGSLDTLTSQPGVALVRSTGRQVFSQLSVMHFDGVIHNDLKPENINVHKDGRILPADFGLASSVAQGAAIGTPAYAAPEHCPNHRGPGPGTATDIWSAGLSLALAHVPIQGSPFAVTDIKDMQQMHDAFASWRARLGPTTVGTLGPRLAQDPNDPFSAFFAKVHQADPTLCGYLLTRLLVPADVRATAAEAHAFFAHLQPAHDPQEHALTQQLASRDDTPYRRAATLALQSRFEIEAGAPRAATKG